MLVWLTFCLYIFTQQPQIPHHLFFSPLDFGLLLLDSLFIFLPLSCFHWDFPTVPFTDTVSMSVWLSDWLSVCLSVCFSLHSLLSSPLLKFTPNPIDSSCGWLLVYLPACLSACLFACVSVCLSKCVCLPAFLTFCLSGCLSVCLSVCLSQENF